MRNTRILEKLLSACWKHFESPYLYRTDDYCDQGNLYIRWNERHLSNSLQRQHVYSTLKWHGNGHFHVVSAWNTSGVFVGLFWNTNDSIANFLWLKYVNLWEDNKCQKLTASKLCGDVLRYWIFSFGWLDPFIAKL